MRSITVFDTTLRDGEQSPGASMTTSQKLTIAHHLAEMGVNVIEAGFPVSSKEQFKASQLIAREVKNASIAVLARAIERDIDAAHEAVKYAQEPRIHTFIASSPIHRQHKLKKSKGEVLEMARRAVMYARSKCSNVEFSPEDATRTERDFLAQIVEVAISAGATTINIPDTVGYITPDEYTDIIAFLIRNVPNMDRAVLSTHCHDDLGLAVVNSLAAVKAGAQQVEVTVNGIGERAGNAALEEVVMNLSLRSESWKATTTVETERLYALSKIVSTITGFPIPRNKAIVGDNAFAHEAGIHQDGVLKHRETYEIMTPQMVGRDKSSIVLGRHSGLHGLKSRLQELHIDVDEGTLAKLFDRFSEIADKKKEVYDEDIYALIHDISDKKHALYELTSFHTSPDTNGETKGHCARIVIKTPHGERSASHEGDGPVDALFKSIAKACNVKARLEEFHIDAVTPGADAMGETTVVVTIDGKRCTGRASSTDILMASAHAYIAAINNYVMWKGAKEGTA